MQRQAPGSQRGKCLSCVSADPYCACDSWLLGASYPIGNPCCSEPGGLASRCPEKLMSPFAFLPSDYSCLYTVGC